MQIKFKINKSETTPGQNVYVVGNKSQLGNWNIKQAHRLATKKGMYPKWESKETLQFHSRDDCTNIEYKYIILNDKFECSWESG